MTNNKTRAPNRLGFWLLALGIFDEVSDNNSRDWLSFVIKKRDHKSTIGISKLLPGVAPFFEPAIFDSVPAESREFKQDFGSLWRFYGFV